MWVIRLINGSTFCSEYLENIIYFLFQLSMEKRWHVFFSKLGPEFEENKRLIKSKD